MRLDLIIDPLPRQRGNQWIVETHTRHEGVRFTAYAERAFPTEGEARAWAKQSVIDGARWLRSDLTPTIAFPDIRAWKDPSGLALTVAVDGRIIADAVTSPRDLKRALLEHPRAEEITARPCQRCGSYPIINLAENTLRHREETCTIRILMRHTEIPMGLKLAAWNTYFCERLRALTLLPVTLPHLEELGLLKAPTEKEMIERIRRIELL